jgi:hypothetical protein
MSVWLWKCGGPCGICFVDKIGKDDDSLPGQPAGVKRCVLVVGEALVWSDGRSGTLDLIADLAKAGPGYQLRWILEGCNEAEKGCGRPTNSFVFNGYIVMYSSTS